MYSQLPRVYTAIMQINSELRDEEDPGWPKIGESRHLATKSEVMLNKFGGKKKCNDHCNILDSVKDLPGCFRGDFLLKTTL